MLKLPVLVIQITILLDLPDMRDIGNLQVTTAKIAAGTGAKIADDAINSVTTRMDL